MRRPCRLPPTIFRAGSDMMKHVAPLGWEHLSLTGDYAWDMGDLPGPGELRLLRNKPSLLAARAAPPPPNRRNTRLTDADRPGTGTDEP